MCYINLRFTYLLTSYLSHYSRYGELPAVNLFRVILTVINTVYFSTWLHKHKVHLTQFCNSDRKHSLMLCEKCFFSSAFARQTFTLWPDMLNIVWTTVTICVRDRPCFTVFQIKIEQNSFIIVKFNAILAVLTFMQIRQRIFKCTDNQITHFILDKIMKLLTYYTPFYHQSLQSYLISKTVMFFWPTL